MSRSQPGKQRVPVIRLVGLQPDPAVRVRRHAVEDRQQRPCVIPGHRPDLRRRERQELGQTEQPPCVATMRRPRIAFRVFPDQEKDAAEPDPGVVTPWFSLRGRTMPACKIRERFLGGSPARKILGGTATEILRQRVHRPFDFPDIPAARIHKVTFVEHPHREIIDQIDGVPPLPMVVVRLRPPFHESRPTGQLGKVTPQGFDPALVGISQRTQAPDERILGRIRQAMYHAAKPSNPQESSREIPRCKAPPEGVESLLPAGGLPRRHPLIEENRAPFDHFPVDHADDVGARQPAAPLPRGHILPDAVEVGCQQLQAVRRDGGIHGLCFARGRREHFALETHLQFRLLEFVEGERIRAADSQDAKNGRPKLRCDLFRGLPCRGGKQPGAAVRREIGKQPQKRPLADPGPECGRLQRADPEGDMAGNDIEGPDPAPTEDHFLAHVDSGKFKPFDRTSEVIGFYVPARQHAAVLFVCQVTTSAGKAIRLADRRVEGQMFEAVKGIVVDEHPHRPERRNGLARQGDRGQHPLPVDFGDRTCLLDAFGGHRGSPEKSSRHDPISEHLLTCKPSSQGEDPPLSPPPGRTPGAG